MDNKDAALKRKIEKRKKKVVEFISFANEILSEIGERIFYEEYSGHTKIKRWLTGFAHFSFHAYYGQTCMGGNTITIYYHPNNETIGIEALPAVLKVYSQAPSFNPDDIDIQIWDEKWPWQSALTKVIIQKDAILAQIENAEKKD